MKKIISLSGILALSTSTLALASCSKSSVVIKAIKSKRHGEIDKIDGGVSKKKNEITKITSIENLFKKYKTTIAKPSFVQGKIFGKAPQSVKEADLTIENLGLTKLNSNLIKLHSKIINISVINKTRDDAKGTMDIRVSYDLNGIPKTKIITVSGLLKTLDIKLDADHFDTINQIIHALDNATGLGFKKSIAKMTPQNLKDELVQLKDKLMGGSVTVIGHYKNKTEAVSFQKRIMLDNLINSFGDVSNRKRISGFFNFLTATTNIMSAIGGDIFSLFAKYGGDIMSTGNTNNAIYLIGSLPSGVIKKFPDLLNMFSTVAEMVKKMSIVKEWAADHKKTKELKNIDHTLVKFVLNSGK